MTDREERIYLDGRQAAWQRVLSLALRELGIDDAEAGKARWAVERTEAVALLRRICREHGDNEWDDNLHLADVIEKHLLRHLDLE